jgi:hypothetical protein
MIKKCMIFSAALLVAAPAAVWAQQPAPAPHAGKAPGPCEEILQACESAGFVKGDAKKGYGLYKDCADPIVRGTAQPANADKPLPQVSSEVVAACKAKHPNFGMGKSAAPPAKSP